MKPVTAAASAIIFMILLAAGAVVAEPPLPTITYYQDDTALLSRPMTTREHTEYLKMRLALETAGEAIDPGSLASASVDLAARGLQQAVKAIMNSSDANHSHTEQQKFEAMAETIGEEAEAIGRLASRMGKAVEAFQKEVAANAGDLTYNRIKIGDGDDALSFDFDASSTD